MMKCHPTLIWLRAFFLAICASMLFAEEGNAIKSVDIKIDALEQQQVVITLQKPVSVPASFTVNTPPRIAFDFLNTSNETGKTSLPINSLNLRGVSIAEASGRTRLVLNLIRTVSYDAKVDGNTLIVTLIPAASSQVVSNGTSQFSPAQNSQKEGIKDVDFRRGRNGEARLSVELSSSTIGIDIRQQGKNLIVEFAKTVLPRQFERRMDVIDFGTAVQNIDTYAQGDMVKMVIEPKGTWEYSAYQTENRFIVEVKSVDEQAKRLSQLDKPVYKGDKLSLNFQNVEVRTVLQVIAEFTGKNVITSDTVNGNLTLRLKDVPWDQALDLILQSKGLDKRDNGNVMWVAPREEIAAREKLTLESKQAISDIEPLRAESFQLNYLKAEDIKTMLMSDKQSFLSKRGSAVVEARTNMLIVNDIPSKLEEIRNLLTRSDIAARQVMIEARIVIASDTFSRSLGARLGIAGDRTLSSGSGSNTRVGIGSTSEDSLGRLTSLSSAVASNVNLPASTSGAAPGTLGITLLNSSVGALLSLELQALEADGNGRTVSSPRVITGDQQKATISQGTTFYVGGGSGLNGAIIAPQKESAVLKLEVTPRITPDRRIFMELNISKDALLSAGNNPIVDTRSVQTNVLVGNGDTAVIGGIYELTENTGENRIPYLASVPVLGNLFKNKSSANTKTELLIFITPRILDEGLTLR